ncbi:hypothetical protein [Saezia sanguinis]|uniref:hypothetical protein n=1 Tax=Saezia sanguinis TaxID=1965230 RepID=UPI003034C01A
MSKGESAKKGRRVRIGVAADKAAGADLLDAEVNAQAENTADSPQGSADLGGAVVKGGDVRVGTAAQAEVQPEGASKAQSKVPKKVSQKGSGAPGAGKQGKRPAANVSVGKKKKGRRSKAGQYNRGVLVATGAAIVVVLLLMVALAAMMGEKPPAAVNAPVEQAVQAGESGEALEGAETAPQPEQSPQQQTGQQIDQQTEQGPDRQESVIQPHEGLVQQGGVPEVMQQEQDAQEPEVVQEPAPAQDMTEVFGLKLGQPLALPACVPAEVRRIPGVPDEEFKELVRRIYAEPMVMCVRRDVGQGLVNGVSHEQVMVFFPVGAQPSMGDFHWAFGYLDDAGRLMKVLFQARADSQQVVMQRLRLMLGAPQRVEMDTVDTARVKSAFWDKGGLTVLYAEEGRLDRHGVVTVLAK